MLDKIKKIALDHILTVVGLGLGIIAGFLYWNYIGCSSGQCVIKSNPYYMTIYGGILGALTFNVFEKKKENNIKQ